ncbi:MAG: type II CAAX endopeptidase family protein [Silvibacterium sp.]
MNSPHRVRSFAWFLIAVVYYILAKNIAATAASGLSSGDWFEFANRSILLFLLIIGFAAMGYVGQRQHQPVKEMGLNPRPGWRREFALGSAIGWAGVTVCALMIAVFGGMVVVFYLGWRQFALLPLDLAILLVASLAEEVAFRGYPFQRLIEATNPLVATLILSVLFSLIHINNPGATTASALVTMSAGWLLSVAYLRTRALWVGWGIHFAWNASMAVLFGLPLSGLTQFSPVISATALGPTWLTGFDYGPEGSAVAIIVILALIMATVYATRDLKHQHAQPVIIPGGIPVDIDAAARRQHEAAMGPAEPAPPQIVQIAGTQSPRATLEDEASQPPKNSE